MSLISEALRRARDEAARREAASRGLPLKPHYRAKDRQRWLTVAVLLLAVALAATLLTLLQMTTSLPASNARAEREPLYPSAAAAVTTTPSPRAAATEPTPTSDPPSERPPSPRDAAPETPTPAQPPLEGETVEPSADADPPTPSDDGAAPETAPAQASPTQPRVFVRTAELRDGRPLDLGGIAWSETGPFALLNGRVVGIGESVRGYLVTEISPQEVVLQHADDRVVLRLK